MYDEQDMVHQHVWRTRVRVDQCHYTQHIEYCVSCGETHSTFDQRDFIHEPLDKAFARQNCPICRRLLKGIEPESWAVAS